MIGCYDPNDKGDEKFYIFSDYLLDYLDVCLEDVLRSAALF